MAELLIALVLGAVVIAVVVLFLRSESKQKSMSNQNEKKPQKSKQLSINRIVIYPVKSCAGIEVQRARLTDLGLKYDRQFMIVKDENKRFVTQRNVPRMSLIHPQIDEKTEQLTLTAANTKSVTIPIKSNDRTKYNAVVFSDTVFVEDMGQEVSDWITSFLNLDTTEKTVYRLVGTTTGYSRTVAPDDLIFPMTQKIENPQTSLADGSPYMIASLGSLAMVNKNLPDGEPQLKINRFRPNIVVEGSDTPFIEDHWKTIQIGTNDNTRLCAHSKCVRCKLTTVIQEQGEFSKTQQPVETLKRVRLSQTDKNSFYFGQLFVAPSTAFGGEIKVGDQVTILEELKQEEIPDVQKVKA